MQDIVFCEQTTPAQLSSSMMSQNSPVKPGVRVGGCVLRNIYGDQFTAVTLSYYPVSFISFYYLSPPLTYSPTLFSNPTHLFISRPISSLQTSLLSSYLLPSPHFSPLISSHPTSSPLLSSHLLSSHLLSSHVLSSYLLYSNLVSIYKTELRVGP